MATGNKDAEAVGKAAIALIVAPFAMAFFIALFLPTTIYAAYVAQQFWGWFVQPLIDRPAPSLFATTGILLLIRLTAYKVDCRDYTTEEKAVKYNVFQFWFLSVVVISMSWLIGYVVHLLNVAYPTW